MSLFYRLAYAVGFTPWESDEQRQVARVDSWFAREEAGRTPPFGRALDMGCGTGIQVVRLALRGWDVTGIEREARALKQARARAEAARVNVRFLEGDVTALRSAGVEAGLRLVLDFGCFHGLGDDERMAVGRELSALAAPGATLLLVSFAPGFRGPLPRGASREDVQRAFPHWHIVDAEPIQSSLPKPLQHGAAHCYRLRHGPAPEAGVA
jgi:SAM-dependent methyltransferase